jgi:hypothetical protein
MLRIVPHVVWDEWIGVADADLSLLRRTIQAQLARFAAMQALACAPCEPQQKGPSQEGPRRACVEDRREADFRSLARWLFRCRAAELQRLVLLTAACGEGDDSA